MLPSLNTPFSVTDSSYFLTALPGPVSFVLLLLYSFIQACIIPFLDCFIYSKPSNIINKQVTLKFIYLVYFLLITHLLNICYFSGTQW